MVDLAKINGLSVADIGKYCGRAAADIGKVFGAAWSHSVNVADVFSSDLYNGNSSTQIITNGINLSGNGGLVWLKARNQAYSHNLFDTVRGASYSIGSDSIGASYTTTRLNSFDSTGFTLNADDYTNKTGDNYVAWTFRKAAKFFDIVSYTGDGTTGRVIPHNLGIAPGMIFLKRTDANQEWVLWHGSAGSYEGRVNETSVFGWEYITGATANDFTVTYAGNATNLNGATYIAYLFAHDPSDSGLIQCGSADGSAVLPIEVTLGWRPQFVIFRRYDGTSSLGVSDDQRGFTQSSWKLLAANSSAVESDTSPSDYTYATSTGFLMSGFGYGQYIYIAIKAEE